MKQRPAALQQGDTAIILAPSSPANIEDVEQMKSKLEKLGLVVRIGDSVMKRRGYLSGDDTERAKDIYEAFVDPNVKAVFCARGGYGSARLLPYLPFSLFRNHPKIFWGYSDSTALHIAFGKLSKLVTFHGPMMNDGNIDEISFSSFAQLFTPQSITLQADEDSYPVFSHRIAAPIVGGNVTVMTSTLGSPYELDTDGSIVLLEDIGEEPYRLDRMLNQLKLAGKFERCKGIILGDFHACEPKSGMPSLTLSDIVYDHIVPYHIPIVSGFPIGHCRPNRGIPLGTATIDGTNRTVTFDPGVQEKPSR